jgi:hypothetical protein
MLYGITTTDNQLRMIATVKNHQNLDGATMYESFVDTQIFSGHFWVSKNAINETSSNKFKIIDKADTCRKMSRG